MKDKSIKKFNLKWKTVSNLKQRSIINSSLQDNFQKLHSIWSMALQTGFNWRDKKDLREIKQVRTFWNKLHQKIV